MLLRRIQSFVKDPVWLRLLSFSLTLFFIFLGDAILSFWVPNLLQDALGDSVKMGLVISFSSVIGLGMDLIFPQLIRGITVKRLVTFGATTSILFSVILLTSLKLPLILIFLIAMAVWGVYYEFFGFAEQQFIADTLPLRMHSSGWAFYGVFKNLAYFLGPLIAAWVVIKAEWAPPIFAIFFALIGLVVIFFFKKTHERPFSFSVKEVNLWQEIKHWRLLIKYVWPMVVLSLVLGLIDSTFWTTGTVLTERLARENIFGGFFIPLYQLPSLFMGLVLARMTVFNGKKRLAMKFLLVSGIFLTILGFVNSIYLILLSVLASSILLAVAFPLVNGIYSDIIARMGVERKHLIGLSNSSISIAYIIGPALAGIISNLVGEEKTFSVMGAITILVAVTLLILTPKKIRLP
ncbi:MAG TPA: MFS transporter, partial [Patescibacteria group bacterium]|nr:MFS transporter [Patescibacteria group bacterium]